MNTDTLRPVIIRLRQGIAATWTCLRNRPVPFWEQTLFALFALSVMLLPVGQIFRVALPMLCLPVLAVLYIRDWPNRTLRRLPVWWLFAVFFAAIIFQVAASDWLDLSWNTVRPNLLRGFLLPFVAMECVRGEQDLRRLTGAFVFAAVLTGLSGLWQFGTGADFLTGMPPSTPQGSGAVFAPGELSSLRDFRLTGPLSTYRVGNYLALIGLPACGLLMLWPRRLPLALRAALTFCVLAPAVFLWVGAQARSGYLAVIGGFYVSWLLFMRPHWKIAVLPPLLGLLLVLFGPERISLAHALTDERRAIWSTAWQCIKVHPWFGTGVETYAPACATLGITHLSTGNAVPPHPHNVYVQWLVDGGVTAFAMMGLFVFGLAGWSARKIRQGLRAAERCSGLSTERGAELGSYWRLTAFFWAGWCGYLINGLAAHGFYRTWWVATAFSVLGILLGACARGPLPAETTPSQPS